MLNQIIRFLLETFFGLFIFILLARFYLQAFRASFHNPVGSFVLALSNWIVLPARKVIPSLYGLDLATFLVALLAESLLLFLLLSLRGAGMDSAADVAPGILLAVALFELARMSIHLLIGVVILQAVLSWVNPYTPLAPMMNTLTRPFYRVFQRFIPPIGGIDLSPLFLLVGLQVMLFLLVYLQGAMARST